MKKLFSALAVILFAAITLTSCGGSDVDKVVGIINDTAEKVKALELYDVDGQRSADENCTKELMQFKDSKQELTEADRKALFDAMWNYYNAVLDCTKVSFSKRDYELYKMQLESAINKCRTLGDLLKFIS